MSILGIENRTENWCTVRTLSPLVDESSPTRIALASHLFGSGEQIGGHVEFELFWYGMRDYADMQKQVGNPIKPDQVVECYNDSFSDLRRTIVDWGKCKPRNRRFHALKEHNYVAGEATKKKLYKELRHTEIDIVFQTQSHLCIGEAKCEASPGAVSKDVLVHQLIRQYVMAKILVELTGKDKEVVPFLVGDCPGKLMETSQVKFMFEMSYLSEGNVLSWEDVQKF